MSEESNERALKLQRNAQAQRLQRKQRLSALIAKRKENVSYLKRAHQGKTHWMNCALLTSLDIQAYALTKVPKQRALTYLYLALSLSKLLDASPQVVSGLPFVRAISQLVEEWEFHFSGAALQSVKLLTQSKTSNCVYPQFSRLASEGVGSGDTPLTPADRDGESSGASTTTSSSTASATSTTVKFSPALYKFSNSVVYEFLLTPHVPFDLIDYTEVFISLCDSLHSMYERLGAHPDCFSVSAAYNAILRVDDRLRVGIINLVAKELTELSLSATHRAFEMLRTDFPPSFPPRA